MTKASLVSLLLFLVVFVGGCHRIHHVKDVRAGEPGKIEVEKCDYYINGFWGTGGYDGCRIETITVK